MYIQQDHMTKLVANANDVDANTRRTVHNCTGCLAFMPNEAITINK